MDHRRLYRLGFIVLRAGTVAALPQPLETWTRLHIDGWQLHVHPDAPVTSVEDAAGRRSIAIGDVFVAHGHRSLDQHLLIIAGGGRTSLEDLSGRFVIITVSADGVALLNDPLGSQTVFYSESTDVAGSHAALVAEALKIPKSRTVQQYMGMDEYKARTTRFLPGDLSLFDGVRLLVPNNELMLPGSRTRRYWPNGPKGTAGPDDAFAAWDEYFTNYAAYLEPRYRPVLGLTGGLDSRSVIATLRAKGLRPRYETWDAMAEEESRRIPAMVEHLQGPHRWIDMKRKSDDPDFRRVREAAKIAAGYTRGTPLLPAQVGEGAGPHDLFVYGHGSGVMRGVFSRAAKPWLPEEPLKRAYSLYAGTVKRTASREYRDFTMQAFQGFFERGNYDANLFDSDIGDLLYWEHRMANWAALQIASFTAAINSHSGLNSRRLFTTFWGLADDQRLTKAVQHNIMKQYDATLAAL